MHSYYLGSFCGAEKEKTETEAVPRQIIFTSDAMKLRHQVKVQS